MTRVKIEIRVSGIRQMISAVAESAGRCLLVDPGCLPREIEELQSLAGSLGHVRALALTHAHCDRLMGPAYFPDVPVWVSESLEQDIAQSKEIFTAGMKAASSFDAEWYLQRPGPGTWPKSLCGLSEGDRRRVGNMSVQVLLLPGHSPDAMGLLIEEAGILFAGDYLCPCEIPVLDDFSQYYRTLHRIVELLDKEVKQVIPGRGWSLGNDEARKIASEDLSYLYQLMFFRDSGDIQSAEHMMLPRQNHNEIIRKLHASNCRKVTQGMDVSGS